MNKPHKLEKNKQKPDFLRSYGRVKGRALRPSQESLVKEILPSLTVDESKLSFPQKLFASEKQDIWLEIGFGTGDHLAGQAKNYPDIGFIGAEPFLNGVVSFLGKIVGQDKSNIRIWPKDVRILLANIKKESLGRVFILFPDPWPKERHKKRRLISTPFLDHLHAVMRSGAELVIATDHQDYFEHILGHIKNYPGFAINAKNEADFSIPPKDWIKTKYQNKAALQGREPFFITSSRV